MVGSIASHRFRIHSQTQRRPSIVRKPRAAPLSSWRRRAETLKELLPRSRFKSWLGDLKQLHGLIGDSILSLGVKASVNGCVIEAL
uniref:Uncharacterized protein n=1 Tax=Oryzias melastigma TaxID=30732 RepID=A0A3B3E0W7_ORYME